MNINLIGFGSIGKRHLKHLLRFQTIKEINVYTRNIIKNDNSDERVKFLEFSELNKKKSFLTIIATPANVHLDLINNFYDYSRFILVEKPLCDYNAKFELEKIDPEKKIFVGYNLRLLEIIKNFRKIINNLEEEKVPFTLNVINTSHIKTWRDQDIKKSISLNPGKGGGCLLELSHDIDLVNHLLGIEYNKISIQRVKKPLDIPNIDSSYYCLGLSKKNIPFSIFSSFSSHINRKRYLIDSESFSYEADLLSNKMIKYNLGDVVEIKNFQDSRDETFYKQIKNIINLKENQKNDLLCSINDAASLQKIFLKSKWLR
jgi:predicted dehydrogenase